MGTATGTVPVPARSNCASPGCARAPSGLPGAASDGREGAHRRGAGGLRAGRLDPRSGRPRAGDGNERHLQEPGELCVEIDDKVKTFLGRPIEGGWPYLWIDATYVKVRQNGRIVSVAVIIAIGVNSDGRREVLGLDIGPSEAETFWSAFLRKLARRGLRGVKLVISDAHEGIKAAVAKVLNATWQRCRVHFMRNARRMPARAAGASSPPSSPPPSPRTMPRPPQRSGARLPTSYASSCRSSAASSTRPSRTCSPT
jgi:putative transposase